MGPAAELIANAISTLFFECVVVSFGLEGKYASLKGEMNKSVKTAITKASSQYGKKGPLISEVLEQFRLEQGRLTDLAQARYEKTGKDKRHEDTHAALLQLRKVSFGWLARLCLNWMQ